MKILHYSTKQFLEEKADQKKENNHKSQNILYGVETCRENKLKS